VFQGNPKIQTGMKGNWFPWLVMEDSIHDFAFWCIILFDWLTGVHKLWTSHRIIISGGLKAPTVCPGGPKRGNIVIFLAI